MIETEGTQKKISKALGSGRPKREREPAISGFWMRLTAFIFDVALLGVFGILLGLVFKEIFIKMGAWGKIVGFVITILYLGILNSAIGKGQTIGKKVMGIKVIDVNGEYITAGRSFLRALVLSLPIFVNQLMLPPSLLVQPFSTVLGLIVFGLGGGIIYFYIFNRETRQSIHDLACRTYVVRQETERPIKPPPVDILHYYILGFIIILITFVTEVIMPKITSTIYYTGLNNLQREICEKENALYAGVLVGETNLVTGKKTFIMVDFACRGKPDDIEAKAENIAKIVLDSYLKSNDKDLVEIKIRYGYDIGIATKWDEYVFAMPPLEWKQKMRGIK